MKVGVAGLLVLLVALVGASDDDKESRIVGGTEVASGDLQFMVAIFMDVNDEISFHCGGSLITQYHVITAGHCVEGWYAERFTVRWSSNHDLESPSEDEVTLQVESIQLFPYFHFEVSTAIPTNDIAILTLSEPLLIDDVIFLPAQDAVMDPGTMCVTAGWGSLEDGGDLSTKLNSVEVQLQNFTTCFDSYRSKMKETMICAGYPEGGKDACAGDSGGPLICDGLLTGIVSWGDGCAEPNHFGVYTDVAIYSEWVEKHNFVMGYPEGSEMTY